MGKVYLLGAGPGNGAYLTLRGLQVLSQAEVLIYDALVDAQLLDWVPKTCERLDVGKRGGQPSLSQAAINQLLVEQAQTGKQVVRLKSGDPFIFGRCTAELEALREAGCDWEVIPGISSALAAPLLAGIPLTDPVLSRCFAVMSAHDPFALRWEALAELETLVILMGGQHLGEIIHQLQKHGRSHQTPIAIIRWAGHPQEQIWTGTLGDIAQQTAGVTLSPSVMVIGEVVRLREFLSPGQLEPRQPEPVHSELEPCSDWVSDVVMSSVASGPLAGKRVLVTRAAGQSSQFTQRLQAVGATVIEMPALAILPPSSWAALDGAIAQLPTFDWLILTSGNGVDYFFDRLASWNLDARALAGVKIAVVGEKTAQSLQKRGLQPDFIPPDFVADALVSHFPENPDGLKLLFPRVESGGREVLVAEFTAKGAVVTEVAAYQSGCPEAIAPAALQALQAQAVDIITFASSKTVRYFQELVRKTPELQLPDDWHQRVCIASIGPQTSQTCEEIFGRVDVEAREYTLEGLTQAIAQWAQSAG